MKEVRKLTAALPRAEARAVLAYMLWPRAGGWEKIEEFIVGPVGFRLSSAVQLAHAGKWPDVQEDGSWEAPDSLQVARGLREGLELLKPSGPRFPEGGTPGAGAGEIYEKKENVA